MHSPVIGAGLVGNFPARLRPGTGIPLLICHPQRAQDGLPWILERAHGGRPVVLLGTGDMKRFSCDGERVVEDLVALAGWQDTPDLHVLGYSAGGFTALLYGALLPLALPKTRVAITAMNPLVSVFPAIGGARNPRHEKVIRVAERTPLWRTRMLRYGNTRPLLEEAAAAAGDRLSVDVVFAAMHARDSAEAASLADVGGVRLLPVPTPQHGLHTFLTMATDRRRLIGWLSRRIGPALGEDAGVAELRRAAGVADSFLAICRRHPDAIDLLRERRALPQQD